MPVSNENWIESFTSVSGVLGNFWRYKLNQLLSSGPWLKTATKPTTGQEWKLSFGVLFDSNLQLESV